MNATGTAAVEAAGLSLDLGGRRVVSDAALSVKRGEVLALLGPNGAGKSSILSLLALLRRPTTGTVSYGGTRVDHLRGRALLEARRRVACVFQDPLLLQRSVAFNVGLGLRLRGVARDDRDVRAAKAMELLGIAELAGRPARALSGGEARRASIARALAVSPEVLLLDEPFAGLDASTRRGLMVDAAELLAAGGRSAVLVTHDRAEAMALADRVAVLAGGELRQVDATAEVMGHPVDDSTAALLGFDDALDGEARGRDESGRIVVRLTPKLELAVSPRPDAPEDGPVRLRLRPEDVGLILPGCGPRREPKETPVEGKVLRVVHEGLACRITVDAGVELSALVPPREAAAAGLAPGDTARLSIPADAPQLYRR